MTGENKRNGVHYRYYPQDLPLTACHNIYTQKNRKPEQNFNEICQQFSPAFKFFFLETFLGPVEHYQAKVRYTKSTAVASMVGYILGLGDRHLSNILVDVKTGELVHIDLGIAFDKGKILPTPELVPFRLTRDIVDGFGPLGTEGCFR